MNPIYAFTDEYERDMAVANREFEIAMAEASMMMESVTRQLKVNMALSELKVMQESGTAEDLTILLMEAGEEAAQQNEGIFSKIFAAIGRFFQSMANGLRNFFSKNKDGLAAAKAANATVEIDGETDAMIGFLGKAAPHIEAAGNAKDRASFLKYIGMAAGVFGASYALYKGTGLLFDKNKREAKKQIPIAEAEQKGNFVSNMLSKITGIFKKNEPTLPKGTTEINPELQAKADARRAEKTAAAQADAAKQAEVQRQADAAASLTKAGKVNQIGDVTAKMGASQEDKDAARLQRKKDEDKQRKQKELDTVNSQRRAQGLVPYASWDEMRKFQAIDNAAKAEKTPQKFADKFIGMFEAGEAGSADQGNQDVSFLQKAISWISTTIQGAINAVIAKFSKGGATVKDLGQAAVNGAAQTVADNTAEPKQGFFQKVGNGVKNLVGGGQKNGFLGDTEEEIEEATITDIDPIEAMLSGLAFGEGNA